MADKDLLISLFADMSKETLDSRLAGIYLHGSAAMGCYQPKKSDLDFLVVVNTALSDAEKSRFMDRLLELDQACPAKGIEMSIVTKDVCNPFVYPTPFILHYSRMHTGWYQGDPEDYIRKMNGTDKDLAAHFTVTRSRGLCIYGVPVQEMFGEVPEQDYLDSIWNDIAGAEEEITENPMYLILNMARVLAYLKEKKVMSKKEGGVWGLKTLPEQYQKLIRSALLEYEDGNDVQYDREAAKEYAAYMLEQITHERNETEGSTRNVTKVEIVGDNYYGKWDKTRTACRGIVIRDHRLLLSYETVTGQWMLPGGGLEEGEDERECCIREVAEETGFLISPSECVLEIDEYYEDFKWVSRYFFGEVTGETTVHLTEGEKEVGMEPRWLPPDEIIHIFSEHASYADHDEMRRGMYLREYTALSKLCGGVSSDGFRIKINRRGEKP